MKLYFVISHCDSHCCVPCFAVLAMPIAPLQASVSFLDAKHLLLSVQKMVDMDSSIVAIFLGKFHLSRIVTQNFSSSASETISFAKNILELQKLTLASYFFLEISSCLGFDLFSVKSA